MRLQKNVITLACRSVEFRDFEVTSISYVDLEVGVEGVLFLEADSEA